MFPESEAITGKHTVVEADPLCPLCGGSGSLRTTPYPYDKKMCPLCEGRKFVPRDVFDKYLLEHPESLAAKQLVKEKDR